MSSTILLRHLSNSSLVGQSKEFTGGRIRLGRKPDNDVVFNPDLDRAVSGHHCDIVLEGNDLYVEDTGSTNGTFVNGLRVQGRVKVTNRDQITLGDRGPTLAVSLAVPAGLGPNTIVGNVPAAGAAPAFTRPGAAPAYSLEAPHPGVTAVPPPMPPSLTNSAANRPTSRASQGAKTSIGMNTLMTELNKVTRRERTRAKMIGIPIIIVLAVGLTLAIWFSSGKPTQIVTNFPSTMPATPAEWSRVLEERKHSVYLVVLKTPNMEDRGNATCWSVAPGVLATNSHVAQLFIDLEEGQSLVARSNANPPVPEKVPFTPHKCTAAYVRGSSSKRTSLHQKIGTPRASNRN